METRLVQVTATVRDKHGAREDLTKNDFEIQDRGKPRTIATFSVSRSADRISPASLPPNTFTNKLDQKGDPPVAATVILFDQLNTEIADQNYARRQVVDFLRSIDPGSPVAIYALGNGLQILHDFTDDRSRLARALERYHSSNSTLLANSDANTLAEGITTAANSVQTADNVSVTSVAPDLVARILEPLQEYSLDRRAAMTLSALQAAASRMSGVPGRKNLIWVSSGFPLTVAFDRGGVSGGIARSVTYASQMREAASAIDRANVVIYPVDARGLKAFDTARVAVTEARDQRGLGQTNNMTTPEEMIGSRNIETMNLLADWTGGKAFYNTNDLRGALKQAAEDSEVTYTLGFYVDQKELDGAYHELKLKVRKGGEVRYRRGYFAMPVSPAEAPSAGSLLTDAALAPVDATGIGLTATLTPQPSAPGTYLLALGMDLQTVALQERNGKWVGAVSVGIIQQAAAGNVLDSTANNITLDLTPENRQQLLRSGLVVRVVIRPAPGMEQIRTAVMDQTSGLIGSLRIPGPK